jgi:hypothetical protein
MILWDKWTGQASKADVIQDNNMNTIEETAKLLHDLLPQIKKLESSIEIKLRGQVVKLPIQPQRSRIQSRNYKQYR